MNYICKFSIIKKPEKPHGYLAEETILLILLQLLRDLIIAGNQIKSKSLQTATAA